MLFFSTSSESAASLSAVSLATSIFSAVYKDHETTSSTALVSTPLAPPLLEKHPSCKMALSRTVPSTNTAYRGSCPPSASELAAAVSTVGPCPSSGPPTMSTAWSGRHSLRGSEGGRGEARARESDGAPRDRRRWWAEHVCRCQGSDARRVTKRESEMRFRMNRNVEILTNVV